MSSILNEILISIDYSLDTHFFSFKIDEITRNRLSSIEIGGDFENEPKRILVQFTYSRYRLHLKLGNSFEKALSDKSIRISRVNESRNRACFTFNRNNCGFNFEKSLFDVIETLASEMLQSIPIFRRQKIQLIVVSDTHGDIPMMLLPLFLTKQISRVEYNETSGFLCLNTNFNSSCVFNNGDLFPKDISIAYKSKQLKYIGEILNPIIGRDSYLERFIIRMNLACCVYTNYSIVIGNHDARLLNFEYSIFDRLQKREILSRDIFGKPLICGFYFINTDEELTIYSILHGMFEIEETEAVDSIIIRNRTGNVARRINLELNRNGLSLMDEELERKPIKIDWYRTDLSPDEFLKSNYNYLLKILKLIRTERSPTFKKITYIPILGHSFSYDFVQKLDEGQPVPTSNYEFVKLHDSKIDKTLLDNVVCLDSTGNSEMEKFITNVYRTRIEKTNELKIPFIEEKVKLVGGNEDISLFILFILFIVIIIGIIILICLFIKNSNGRIEKTFHD